jgi:hypothetical protein
MRMTRSRLTPFVVLSLAAAIACGHPHDAATDSAGAAARDSAPPATAPSPSAAVTPASSPASDASAPITVADIDAWQKGMQGELQAVQQAGQQRQSAKSATDTLNAMFAAQESSTRAAGAKAAGVSEARYQYLTSTLGPIVANLSPLESEMSTKDLPAAVVEQMRKSHEASAAQEMAKLSPDVQAALHARAPELRKQSLELAAARLKSAGATH